MHRLPGAPPTVPDVKDYLIRFFGSNPLTRLETKQVITRLAHNCAVLQTIDIISTV